MQVAFFSPVPGLAFFSLDSLFLRLTPAHFCFFMPRFIWMVSPMTYLPFNLGFRRRFVYRHPFCHSNSLFLLFLAFRFYLLYLPRYEFPGIRFCYSLRHMGTWSFLRLIFPWLLLRRFMSLFFSVTSNTTSFFFGPGSIF